MQKIALKVLALGLSKNNSDYYTLVLLSLSDHRIQLSIKIAPLEAQSITLAIEKITPNRPLTHDLFKSLIEQTNINVEEVIICNLIDGIYYSKILCKKDQQSFELDARTSDAIGIALRVKCPIYVYAHILESTGDIENLSTPQQANKSKLPNEFLKLNKKELENRLAHALQEENYEEAAKIRDELKNRY